MNISFPRSESVSEGEPEPLESIADDNPFVESDLPLSQLAENSDQEE